MNKIQQNNLHEDLQVVMSEMQITKRLPSIPPLVVDLVDFDNDDFHKAEPTVFITERAGYKRKSYGKYRREEDKYRDLTIAARLELNRLN